MSNGTMTQPLVDVVIGVHSDTRPILRAVRSVLDSTETPVRVTVVAHNIDREKIASLLQCYAQDARLRVLHFSDGIKSPAGPFNYGLERASAEYYVLMGSDDELEPGAIDNWVWQAQRYGAAAVLARINYADGGTAPQPPVRPFHTGLRDTVSDRLFYRSAPVGIFSREIFGDLRFTAGVATGEDLDFTSRLFTRGAPIAVSLSGPNYLVHRDGTDRVSTQTRELSDELCAVSQLLECDWVRLLPAPQRTALVVKLLRVHVLGAIATRYRAHDALTAAEVEFLRKLVQTARGLSPRAARLLSRVETQLLRAAQLRSQLPPAELVALEKSFCNKTQVRQILPARLVDVFDSNAPLRFGIASILFGKLPPYTSKAGS